MNKKDLFITQNSYYFVHKYFLDFFKNIEIDVIFVREKKRGIIKKYFEIIYEFGLLNSFLIIFGEIKYFFILNNKLRNKKLIFADDLYLNKLIEEKIKKGGYKRVFSIGCPCYIDHTLQDIYSIPIYNLHGGILPHQRGRYSPLKSIKLGHKFLSSSLHLIDSKFDRGKIISQDFYELKDKDFLKNYQKVLRLSSDILKEFLRNEKRFVPKRVIDYFTFLN